MIKEIRVKHIGSDYWDRELYKNIESGRIYASVDGILHTTTSEGEPDCPLRKDLKIIIVED